MYQKEVCGVSQAVEKSRDAKSASAKLVLQTVFIFVSIEQLRVLVVQIDRATLNKGVGHDA